VVASREAQLDGPQVVVVVIEGREVKRYLWRAESIAKFIREHFSESMFSFPENGRYPNRQPGNKTPAGITLLSWIFSSLEKVCAPLVKRRPRQSDVVGIHNNDPLGWISTQ